jgi:transcriptional regulator with XRE-family HTH domain
MSECQDARHLLILFARLGIDIELLINKKPPMPGAEGFRGYSHSKNLTKPPFFFFGFGHGHRFQNYSFVMYRTERSFKVSSMHYTLIFGGEFIVRDNMNYIGAVIKNARQRKTLTQGDFAERIGVSERYVSAIENENRIPSADLLFTIIRELDIPADDIIYPDQKLEDNQAAYITQLLQKCNDREVDAVIALLESLVATAK